MAVTKVLARYLLVEVRTAAPSTYAEVKGLNTVGFSPGENDADTTDFNDDGRLAHIPASRGMEISLEGFRLEDESGGDRDEGQAKVEEIGDEYGDAGLGYFRITSQGGEVWTFRASANVTPNGGGNDDAAAWEAALKVSGAIEKA